MYEFDLVVKWDGKEKSQGTLLNVPSNTWIGEIWEQAKEVIGGVPHSAPFINRYEIERCGRREVVGSFFPLLKNDILILVNC
jgi:hypothetical protein